MNIKKEKEALMKEAFNYCAKKLSSEGNYKWKHQIPKTQLHWKVVTDFFYTKILEEKK